MKKRVIVLLLSVFLLNLDSSGLSAFAQSGRGRKPPESGKTEEPPPQQQSQQSNTGPVPDGGKIVKQEGDGVNSRFILKNGLTIIIREAQAVPLAGIVTYVKTGGSQQDDNT